MTAPTACHSTRLAELVWHRLKTLAEACWRFQGRYCLFHESAFRATLTLIRAALGLISTFIRLAFTCPNDRSDRIERTAFAWLH